MCLAAIAGCVLAISGCAAMMSRTTAGMMQDLSEAILDNNDLEMVRDGAPAYLLMIDSMIRSRPDDQDMLVRGAVLYTAYADMFVTDTLRAQKLSDKALDYALQGMCLARAGLCKAQDMQYEDFDRAVSATTKKDLSALFALGTSWAGWIRARSNDFAAIADIARIEVIMHRITELDETFQDGAAYGYLGTLASLLPPALGGRPDEARRYFEKALALSGHRNLMIKVTFARQYARMMFDKNLHDRLLTEVLEADPQVEGYTLLNTLAREQARTLLESGDDYF